MMIKGFEDFQVAGKENFDATIQSAAAVTKGLQTVAAEVAEYQKKSFEQGTQTLEKVLAAKSLDKAVEIQQAYAKEAYDAFIGEFNKLGQIYMSTAKEAYKPFEAQLAQFNGKVASK